MKSLGHQDRHPYLEVKTSKIHGRGVFARVSIAPRTCLVEYTGERISHRESDRREWERLKKKAAGKASETYLFQVDDRWYLDGSKNGSLARWVNHSCDANCTAYLDQGRVWFYSNRAIAKGEELGIDYAFDFQGWQENPCRCQSPLCVGFIVRKNVRWRVRRAIERKRSAKAGIECVE